MVFISRLSQSRVHFKDVSEMRIICEVCKLEGYLQQLGNYSRVRHYRGKGKFYYHQQTRDWVQTQLRNIEQLNTTTDQNTQLIDQNTSTEDCNKLKSTLDNPNTSKNKSGRRLVWFRTLAFQANDPGFKSRRPHQLITRTNLS